MRLLVSVRSAEEAIMALEGGADIIDAKEPRRGPLGPVSPEVLSEICDRVPPAQELSVALGDVATPADVWRTLSRVPRTDHSATYLKLGFAGLADPDVIRSLLAIALAATVEHPAVRIIAVAYADSGHAGCAPPWLISRVAAEAGAAGILLDTWLKSGGNLLTWIEPEALVELLAAVRAEHLLTAIAGSLRTEDLPAVSWAKPHIVGFRRAVCSGGREGALSTLLVRELREYLDDLDSGSLQITADRRPRGGETPGSPQSRLGEMS
jgi:uncharacterized protein (UPF0264 family)